MKVMKAEILKMPELYEELLNIISIKEIESNELIDKAKILNRILNTYC